MLTTNQAATMLALQDKMNAKVNPNWIQVRSPFLRAVVIEGAEAIEHHGWKWWKKQDCDLAQLQMELVDIWHFVLSAILIKHDGEQTQAQADVFDNLSSQQLNFDGQTYVFAELNLLEKLELLIGLAAAKRYDIGLFSALLADCQMSWDELYAQYVSKNVLNFFRQDNGYKEGTYVKVWSGREDNEHLVEVMAKLDVKAEDYQDQLYHELAKRYALLDLT
ncbi:dUTP diphosphatase [Catenovulum sp. 2E275]|uniref:dUTP diphosphatase n=1 Tax=Catenovulum sp. 2E275 TaxID=2980497 RepID=UPI0021D04A65|nr:dUTP diphosphatase [Catenovulum sp. 2E275]MCU4674367.1 dUTP diphosphatase [Catenovulum sp. 2E275]